MNINATIFSLGCERKNLNVLRHAGYQEILKLLQAELLRASRFQEIVLQEVICTHTNDIQGISYNESRPFFTQQFSHVDPIMLKILKLFRNGQNILFHQIIVRKLDQNIQIYVLTGITHEAAENQFFLCYFLGNKESKIKIFYHLLFRYLCNI